MRGDMTPRFAVPAARSILRRRQSWMRQLPRWTPTVKLNINRTEFVSDLSINDTKVFETLDPDEKKYLPLNYIVSPLMEWKFVQEACASGFRSVANLSRVSNNTIREVANISQYSLNNKTAMIPKLNQAFIEYAAQRGI